MDEKTALTKWCPMSRVAGNIECNDEEVGFTASNRFGNPFQGAPIALQKATHCIASDCAMWVWEDPIQGHPGDVDKYGHCGLIR